MKKRINLKIVFALLITAMIVASCKNEDGLFQKEIGSSQKQAQDVPIKEFELKESWFKTGTSNLKSLSIPLKSSGIPGDMYSNFGVGYDILTNTPMSSVFNQSVSLAPIIGTTKSEKTDFVYTYSTEYNEIDNQVTTALSASLKVSTLWIKANSSLSINHSSRITSSSNSVYVSILSIKRYGRGYLWYPSTLNDYLNYRTNLNDNSGSKGPDGMTTIGMSNTTFRGLYGDEYVSGIYFGVMLSGTVQVTNINTTSYTKADIAASAQAAVQDMVNLGISWSKAIENRANLSSTNIVVDGFAIPRTTATPTSVAELMNQDKYISSCYAAQDLGVLGNEYTKYSYLYPTYNFINLDDQFLLNYSVPVYVGLDSEGNYLLDSNLKALYSPWTKPTQLARWFNYNCDQEGRLKPLFENVLSRECVLIDDYAQFTIRTGQQNTTGVENTSYLVGYVFKEKYWNELVPLYSAYKGGGDQITPNYSVTGNFPVGYSNTKLLGWVFPN